MRRSGSAINGGVLNGFLATTCNFWIVGENPKCFDEFIDEKSCQTSGDFPNLEGFSKIRKFTIRFSIEK